MIYPIIALSNLPQYSTIDVEQFSPLKADALAPLPPEQQPNRLAAVVRKLLRRPPRPAPGRGKLRGAGTFHFGGFFDRSWRANDYLWGRLDTVERLLGLLDEAVHGHAEDRPRPHISTDEAAGLWAVLDSETKLENVDELRKHIESQLPSRTG